MPTRHLIAAGLAAGVLVPAASAQAKEISKVAVCGATACTTFTRHDLDDGQLQSFAGIGSQVAPPAARSAWYRLKISMSEGPGTDLQSWTVAYVPKAGLIRSIGESGQPVWGTVLPETEPLLRKATAGLEAFPAARLTGLHVKLPEAQVSEVVQPVQPAPASAPAAGETPWTWIAIAAAALLAGGIAVLLVRRRPPARPQPLS
jgi:LPXTG-motif cell wall-anchored protein